MATWRELIKNTMQDNNDSFDNIKACTLTEEELDVPFDNGYGSARGEPFTVWTKNFVYFPVVYDGAEWCGSVPRNPNGIKTQHMGGQ